MVQKGPTRHEFDSYFLIDRWKMIKKTPLIALPMDTDFKVGDQESKDIPQGWSPERFARAVARLQPTIIENEETS